MTPRAQQEAQRAGTKILVVDDDPTFQRYARRVLSEEGHDCTIAATVDAARGALTEERFDLLVTDIQLTDGDGLDLLRFVSDHCEFLPVIVVTGFPTVSTAVDALRLEAMDYLTKPAVELDACVSRVLARMERRRADSTLASTRREWSRKLRELAEQLEKEGGALDPLAMTLADDPDRGQAADAGDADGAWTLLTRREADVAKLLLDGLGPPQISAALGISVNTVRNHLQSTYRKIGVRSQVELVARLTRARA